MRHQDITAPNIHPFAFVSATDPALVPANAVTAGKAWLDLSDQNRLKYRNSANTGWVTVGSDGGT